MFECWSSGTVSWASVPCKPAKRRTVKQAHMGTGHGLWGSWQSWVGWGDTARDGATCAAARPPAEPRAGRRGIERVRVRQPRAAPHRAGRCCPVRRLPPRFHRGISRAHRCLRDRTPTHMARLLCWCRCARGTCATAPCPRVLVGSRGRVGLDTRRLPSLSEQPGHVRTRGDALLHVSAGRTRGPRANATPPAVPRRHQSCRVAVSGILGDWHRPGSGAATRSRGAIMPVLLACFDILLRIKKKKKTLVSPRSICMFL